MDLFNINRPDFSSPQPGKLLIAEPFLTDPNFARSVIFVCEQSEEGTVGFALNRLTDLSIEDILPDLLTNSNLAVLQGGPVQMDTLHLLHRLPGQLGGMEIYPGIYWGGSFEALQDIIKAGAYEPADLKLFVGYSGWSPGQLEQEMKEGSWLVSEASTELVFDTEYSNLWKDAVRHMGKDYAYMANLPLNPQLN